jgi:hypothetical protein
MQGSTRIDLQKADQTFGRGDQFSLRLTDERRRRGWDVNSPYYVIEAEPKIMAEHSDIFNPYFIAFLAHFMDGYYTKYERLQKEANRVGKTVETLCEYESPLNTVVGGGVPARSTASVNP